METSVSIAKIAVLTVDTRQIFQVSANESIPKQEIASMNFECGFAVRILPIWQRVFLIHSTITSRTGREW
jgi:hypothetical protein